jgi:crotonobetainyl-CoA:carnitine CoA-transferase CaiB-like acyl-CoA transferase
MNGEIDETEGIESAKTEIAGPLNGVRVIDAGQNITAPVCAMMLRALGADVIKVEPPLRGENSRHSPPYLTKSGLTYDKHDGTGISASYLKRNRGKRSMTLDLKTVAGREIFGRLLATSDVLIENFRPNALKRLGFGFDRLEKLYPRLTLCSISGFGDESKYQNWLAYDGIIQAFSGLLERTGYPDQPPVKSGFPVADNLGAVFSTIGILGALRDRDRTGKGMHVKVSMLECVTFMLWDDPLDYFERQGLPARSGNSNRRTAPWTMYDALDGHVFICAHTDQQWQELSKLIGLESNDERYVTVDKRVAREPEVDGLVNRWTVNLPKDDIAETLQSLGVPCSAVRRPAEVSADPGFERIFTKLNHPVLGPSSEAIAARFPLRSFRTEENLNVAAPSLGANNDRLLDELGYSIDEVKSFRDEGVI